MKKPRMCVLNRFDTNQPVQAQKQPRGLKLWIKKNRDCTIHVAKTKGHINCEADLRLCIKICEMFVFSCDGSELRAEIILIVFFCWSLSDFVPSERYKIFKS